MSFLEMGKKLLLRGTRIGGYSAKAIGELTGGADDLAKGVSVGADKLVVRLETSLAKTKGKGKGKTKSQGKSLERLTAEAYVSVTKSYLGERVRRAADKLSKVND